MTVCIVSNCCPTGCGVPVVVLQACATQTLFCYCDLCGCAWSSPGEAQFDAGLDEINGPEKFAPAGVELMPRDRINHSVWLAAIIRELPDSDWGGSVGDINTAITARVATP
jgi:hypothetical protein